MKLVVGCSNFVAKIHSVHAFICPPSGIYSDGCDSLCHTVTIYRFVSHHHNILLDVTPSLYTAWCHTVTVYTAWCHTVTIYRLVSHRHYIPLGVTTSLYTAWCSPSLYTAWRHTVTIYHLVSHRDYMPLGVTP